jgi:hypothetical protein
VKIDVGMEVDTGGLRLMMSAIPFACMVMIMIIIMRLITAGERGNQ